MVALRKESVDRNSSGLPVFLLRHWSLSARRAWIEIHDGSKRLTRLMPVALRKESVDRNYGAVVTFQHSAGSLSARRAWIEIELSILRYDTSVSVALRKESVDRNRQGRVLIFRDLGRRSPQGERG